MNSKDKTHLILNGSIYKALLYLSVPIMINSLIQTIYNLVDGIWVSKISSVHFAATAFVWPVNFLFISIGIGLSIAGTSILSQFIGANKIKEANEHATQLIVLTVLSAILFSTIGIIFTPFIVKWMGATGDLAKYGIIYLRITFLDMLFMFVFFNYSSIMNSQGNTLYPTIFSAISATINAILDPIFIFTFDLGIAGAAYATLLSRILLAVAGLIHLYRGNSLILPSFKGFRFNIGIIKNIVKVGLPTSVGQSGAAIGFIVLNMFIGSYGTATIAAYAMVNRITSLISQPAMGLGSALTAIVGQNIGANQENRVKESFSKATLLTSILGFIGCFVLLTFDIEIINFFMQSKDDPSVIELSVNYLKYISWSMPLMGIFSVLQGLFQGTGNTKYSMTMEIGRLWFVRLPMILIFKNFTNWGASGIWFSMSFSNLIVCLYGFLIYTKGLWKKSVINLESL
ncbi:MATE family efflux transporter [Soehngenia saccharolytica]|nr:MATE family efflux transporter [Soehngenia saccharolytica]